MIERAKGGDARAFEALVDRYYADCLRYATRMLGDRHDAEEAVQDTFLRAHRSLARYDHRDRCRSWLVGILVNRCRTLGGRRARRHRYADGYEREAKLAAETAPAHDAGEWSEEVQRALLRLAPPAREAFLLKYVEDLSYEEMAQLTGAGVSALKMRVKRACEQLRALLQEVQHG
ncbi:MAG TPA: RNA polymerase sigma factor [Longimicrobium sp.]|nr:RNA polymerase sigma factor [Longimicrobium sp.]